MAKLGCACKSRQPIFGGVNGNTVLAERWFDLPPLCPYPFYPLLSLGFINLRAAITISMLDFNACILTQEKFAGWFGFLLDRVWQRGAEGLILAGTEIGGKRKLAGNLNG